MIEPLTMFGFHWIGPVASVWRDQDDDLRLGPLQAELFARRPDFGPPPPAPPLPGEPRQEGGGE